MQLSQFSQNFDAWGLITKNLDGGDTCSRHFTALYCCDHSPAEANHALQLLQQAGIPIRHPDSTRWYSRPNTTSRDQLIPYLCYVATHRPDYFKQLAAQHAKRAFVFAWNTHRNFQYSTPEEQLAKSNVSWNYAWKLPDICGPNVWAIYLRGLLKHSKISGALAPILKLPLYVLDLQQLVAVSIIYIQLILGYRIGPTSRPRSIDHDMQNLILPCHLAAHNSPTLLSKLTWNMLKPVAKVAAKSFFQQPDEPRLDLALSRLD